MLDISRTAGRCRRPAPRARGRITPDTDPARNEAEYEPEILDADMTPADIIDALKRLNLRLSRRRTIEIGSGVRDYLVSAVFALRRR